MKLYYQKELITLKKLRELSVNQSVKAWLIGEFHFRKECKNFEKKCINLMRPEFILGESLSYLPRLAKEFVAQYIYCDTSNATIHSYDSSEIGKNICKYIEQSKKLVLAIFGSKHLEPESNIYKNLRGKILLIINPLEIISTTTEDAKGTVELEDFIKNRAIVKSYGAVILRS